MYRSGSLKGVRAPSSTSRPPLRNRVARYIDIHSYPKGELEAGGTIIRTISVFSGLRSEEDWSHNCSSPTDWGSERGAVSFGRGAKPCDAYVRFPLPPGLQPFQVKSRANCRLARRTKLSGLAASNGRT